MEREDTEEEGPDPGPLEVQIPAISPHLLCLPGHADAIFLDYCQQVSLPYSSEQKETFQFRTTRKVQVFGVCCEPLCRQVFFLIDEAQHAGKGAMVVCSLLHAFFPCMDRIVGI